MRVIELITRLVTPIFSTVFYLVGFATSQWVVVDSEEITWGLWTYCDNTSFTSGRRADCNYIGVGDSDAYFEAVRVLSCLALILYVGIWVGLRVFLKNLEEKKMLWFFYLVATSGLTVTTLAVMGALYEGDSRWRTKDPHLGYSFWLVLVAAILVTIGAASVIIFGCIDSDSGRDCRCSCDCDCDCDCECPSCNCFQNCCAKKKPAPKVSPFALQPVLIRRAPPRSPPLSSSSSLESSLEITNSPPPQPLPVSRRLSEPAMQRQRRVRTPSPPRPPPILLNDREVEVQEVQEVQEEEVQEVQEVEVQEVQEVEVGEEEVVVPRCRRLPALTLPNYDLPPEPRDGDGLPSLPPPAYEEVVTTVNETDSPDVSYPEDV